jgi:hypothetical protein
MRFGGNTKMSLRTLNLRRSWVVVAAIAVVSTTARANLILDGGFESPLVGPGGFQSGFQAFTVGQTFGTGNPWTVVGSSSGNVAVYPNTETIGSPPTALNVQEGSQAMDLTGNTDTGSPTGVSQSFATTPGSTYSLLFYVGELNNQAASIVVNLNGSLFQTATNNSPTSGNTTLWQLFSYNFTAAGATTTLSFLNNSASGTALNGLDNVSVNLAVSSTPEPGTAVFLGVGLAGLVAARSRRTTRASTRASR